MSGRDEERREAARELEGCSCVRAGTQSPRREKRLRTKSSGVLLGT